MSPPFDGAPGRGEHQTVASKKPGNRAVDPPVPENIQARVTALYHELLNTRMSGRRAAAVAAIAECLLWAASDDDEDSLERLEAIARSARKLSSALGPQELTASGAKPTASFAPERAALIQELCALTAKHKRRSSQFLAEQLFARLVLAKSVIGQPSSLSGVPAAMQLAITKARDRDSDDENIVVWALRGYGLNSREATRVVADAMKSSKV
jgi:hypothetical protein